MSRKYLCIIVSLLVVICTFHFCGFGNWFNFYRTFIIRGIDCKHDPIFREVSQPSFQPKEFDKNARLFYLCKVWGFTKYYSENKSSMSGIDVDDKLLNAISKTINCEDKTEFSSVLSELITSIQTDHTSEKNPYNNINDYALINFEWMNDTTSFDLTIKQQLQNMFKNHSGEAYFVDYRKITGNIEAVNEKIYPDTIPEYNIRLLGLFRYWNIVNYFNPNKNYMDGSWDQTLFEAIPRFEAASTRKDYHLAIYWLTNKLKDTHCSHGFLTDEVVSGQYRPNFQMIKIKDDFIINKIKILAKDDLFKIGDRIIRINNEAVKGLYDSLQQFTGGSNYWAEQSFVCAAMLSAYDSVSNFMVARGSDTLTIVSKNKKRQDYQQYTKNILRKRKKEKLYEWLSDSIAYLDLQCLTPANFNKNYLPIKNAKGIILDLRCYPENQVILNLVNAFVPPSPFFAYAVYPDIRFPGLLRSIKTSGKIGKKNYFKGQVIVLVDEWTESFSEYLTMALQANPNTKVIGSSSSGADGDITMLEFPRKVKTIYSGLSIYYPDFTPTQRCGVKIDYVVEPTLESIQNGTDLALEKAKTIIENGLY